MSKRKYLLTTGLIITLAVLIALCIAPAHTHAVPPSIDDDDEDMDERMEKYAEALGVECTYCHVEDEEEKWTRNKLVAQYMQKHYVDKLSVRQKGQKGKKVKITCNYCHKGKAKTIDRTPPKNRGGGGYGPGRGATGPNANRMWRIMQTFTKGLKVNCNYCHEARNWTGDNGRKKTTRTMYKDYCRNLVKSNNKVLVCYDCHRGKPKFLPTKKDAEKKKREE